MFGIDLSSCCDFGSQRAPLGPEKRSVKMGCGTSEKKKGNADGAIMPALSYVASKHSHYTLHLQFLCILFTTDQRSSTINHHYDTSCGSKTADGDDT